MMDADPVPVAGLVQFQPGSVVSRILWKGPGGSVTLFAFDRGQSLSEHTVPFDALVHVLEGEAEITIDGTPRRVRAGDMLLMPGHHPHAVAAPVAFKMILTMIRTPPQGP
jgi:quercetin dioxygenase-like cupin family protein